MSAQGVQKAAQALNAIGQLLPVIAELDAQEIDIPKVIGGALLRSGITAPELVVAIAAIVKAPI